MRLSICSALVIAALGSGAIGCGGIADPTKNVVETFTNTAEPGGFNYNTFTVSKSGDTQSRWSV